MQQTRLGRTTQYNQLALAVDLIAERIRAFGAPAPGSSWMLRSLLA
ncbi:MAG: hypothetical protein KAY11_04175 [Ilumatobacteraceae bacterium]|nr:hypothetical protein [Ilumatobacteraceae bacterium]MBP7889291.1 hypothetical protein [Ilumatobacteraceae bacterium]MBP8208740.1 hypothetical protein [Ilumatobacteraceae bacterium]